MGKSWKIYMSELLLSGALMGMHGFNAISKPSFEEINESAQSNSSPEKEPKAEKPADNNVKTTGFCLNTTQIDESNSTSTVCFQFLKYPNNRILWINEGNNYDPKTGKNNFDFSIKYLSGKDLYRFTIDQDIKKDNKVDIYGGFDIDKQLFSTGNKNFSILSDIALVKNDDKYNLDESAGVKLNSGAHNAFFLLSDRNDNKSLRLGYLFRNDDKVPLDKTAYALWLDVRKGAKPALSGFMGLKHNRIVESYDIEANTLSSGMILSLGNNPLPIYSRTALKPGQLILTTRNQSIHDADNYHGFQASYFLYPARRYGDVAIVSMTDDFALNIHTASVYNAFGMAMKGKVLAITQKFCHAPGSTQSGIGAGYDFGTKEYRIMPAIMYIRDIVKNQNSFTIDLELSLPPLYQMKK